MTKLIGTGPNQVPSNADLGTLAYQNDDNVTLGLTTIATEGDEPRQGGGTLLRVKRTGNGTWATLAIEAQSYRGNSRIAFVDSDYPNDVLTTGTANGGGAAPFIFDYEHETEKFQMISNAASRITVDSTGKVGIGTDVPTRNLTVKAGSGQEGIELIDADESLFLIQKSGTSTNTSYVSMLSEGDTTVRLHADNVSYFNGGNVGIGTDAPDGKFTVSNSGAEGIEFFPAASSAVNTTQHYNRSGSAYVKNRTIALNHEWVNGATDPAMNLIPDGNSTFLVLKAKASTYSSTANLSLYGTNPNINGGSLVSRATVQAQTDGTAFGTKLRLLTNNASNVETRALTVDASQNVGIGTDDPKANFHVDTTGSSDGFAVGGKNVSLNTTFQTGAQLEISLGNHQACYVKVFLTGDWSGHSAMAFLGEYFIQNGANAYQEAGSIIREVDHTGGPAADYISSMIYDGGNYDSFQIQFKLNTTTGTTSSSGMITYQVMGQFDSIT